MASSTGRPPIKKFLITLTALAAIAGGAVYVVLSPPRPVIKPVVSREPARMLPYEQQLVRKQEPGAPAEAGSAEATPANAPSEHAVAPADTATANAAPEPDAKAQANASQTAQPPSAGAGQAALPAAGGANASNDPAMTPDESVDPSEQAAIPPDDGARPYGNGQRPYDVTTAPPGAAPQGGPYGEAPQGAYAPPAPPVYSRSPRDGLYTGPPPARDAYGGPPPQGDPYGGPPPQGGAYGGPPPQGPYDNAPQGAYGDASPGPYGPDGAPQGAPGAPQEEWVIVLASGAGMRATATDEAPMLFAFPYGRNLRVVSHYQDWVEVTDPKSAATGWMKEAEVSPIAPPGAQSPQEAYDEQPQDERGGFFRRRHGGFADMINRALGGGF